MKRAVRAGVRSNRMLSTSSRGILALGFCASAAVARAAAAAAGAAMASARLAGASTTVAGTAPARRRPDDCVRRRARAAAATATAAARGGRGHGHRGRGRGYRGAAAAAAGAAAASPFHGGEDVGGQGAGRELGRSAAAWAVRRRPAGPFRSTSGRRTPPRRKTVRTDVPNPLIRSARIVRSRNRTLTASAPLRLVANSFTAMTSLGPSSTWPR